MYKYAQRTSKGFAKEKKKDFQRRTSPNNRERDTAKVDCLSEYLPVCLIDMSTLCFATNLSVVLSIFFVSVSFSLGKKKSLSQTDDPFSYRCHCSAVDDDDDLSRFVRRARLQPAGRVVWRDPDPVKWVVLNVSSANHDPCTSDLLLADC